MILTEDKVNSYIHYETILDISPRIKKTSRDLTRSRSTKLSFDRSLRRKCILQNVGKSESALTDQQFFIALYTLCTLLPMTDPLPPPQKKKNEKKNTSTGSFMMKVASSHAAHK